MAVLSSSVILASSNVQIFQLQSKLIPEARLWRPCEAVASRKELLLLNPIRKSIYSKRRFLKLLSYTEDIRKHTSIIFVRFVVTVMIVSSVSNAPTWALSQENLLFLEAWRTIDRAYVDKSFNGQSWFRYRENALRNEPMNNREETYMAIRKMLASLDDPFTRFLEPEKFKSLRAVWDTRCSYRCRSVNRLSYGV